MPAPGPGSDAAALFPGFAERRVRTGGAEIHLVVGGAGPPLLLLHGYPQTHVMGHRVAPALARGFTVVAPAGGALPCGHFLAEEAAEATAAALGEFFAG
jgi:hypothetical protein